jgi:hypothetical protein
MDSSTIRDVIIEDITINSIPDRVTKTRIDETVSRSNSSSKGNHILKIATKNSIKDSLILSTNSSITRVNQNSQCNNSIIAQRYDSPKSLSQSHWIYAPAQTF